MWFLLTPWKAELQRKSNALEQANLSTLLGVRRHLHFLLLQVRPNCCHPQFLREPARSLFLGLHSGCQLKRTPARGGICTAQEPGMPQFRPPHPGKTALPLERYLLKGWQLDTLRPFGISHCGEGAERPGLQGAVTAAQLQVRQPHRASRGIPRPNPRQRHSTLTSARRRPP